MRSQSGERWTVAKVRAMQNESRPWPRYELIDGELLVTPAPTIDHYRAVIWLFRVLDRYLARERVGEAMLSPADLTLRRGTISQPDIFVPPHDEAAAATHWSEIKHLLLVIEVLSPSTARFDRLKKRAHYQKAGVAEYWIVDLEGQVVERWRPMDARPEILSDRLIWHPTGAARPLAVDLAKLFAAARVRPRLVRENGPRDNAPHRPIPGPDGFDIRGWLAQLPRRGWTVEMLDQFPEQFRFEIIDGVLLLPDDIWGDPDS
jgi:Uma2 family endonuclease